MVGFSDKMEQTDNIQVKVECAHNAKGPVAPGEQCPSCGVILPKEDTEDGAQREGPE